MKEVLQTITMGNTNNTYDSHDESDHSDHVDSQESDLDDTLPRETTDAAAEPSSSLPDARKLLNVEKVKEIESKLDIDELISLIYLLLEDHTEIEVQLQHIFLLLKGGSKDILSLWAEYHSHKGDCWEHKLVEALCTIKNYAVLRELGYGKFNVIDHFLPNQPHSLHINKLKKTIYLICDNLNLEETREFLQHVRQSFDRRKIYFDEYGDEYLEVYFLKWESMHQLDYNEIKQILKIIGLEHLKEKLEKVLAEISSQQPEHGPNKSSSNVATALTNPGSYQSIHKEEQFNCDLQMTSRNRKLSSITSIDNQRDEIATIRNFENMTLGRILKEQQYENNFMDFQHNLTPLDESVTNKTMVEDNNCYDIDPNRPGVVLIINQNTFYKDVRKEFQDLLPPANQTLPERQGTNLDRDKLEELFIQFGYQVIVKNDLNHLDMIKEIKNTVDSISDESSLFICIMTHGDEGVIYGCNSCRVKVSKIQEIMFTRNKKKLVGKPKILILQSCQGNECQKSGESRYVDDAHSSLTTDGPSTNIRDTLTFWATFRGYAAIRNRKVGSWFIQTFCRNLKRYGNKLHFLNICTRINGEIQEMKWNKEDDEIRIMTPVLETTLGKDFYLPQLLFESPMSQF